MKPTNIYKDYFSPIKCVVTRIDDPAQLNRVQVYIPAYHGEMNEASKGLNENPGTYPWAQLCTTLFKDNNNATISSMQELFAGNVPVILPPVGTIGWVLFEGGDVRLPIYMGSLSKGEANEYVTSVYSGSDSNNLSIGITGTSQLDIMKNIIFEQESGGKYDDINPKDVNAISIGLIQWHADRARNLLRDMRNANTMDFDTKRNTYGADFNLDGSWSNYYVSKDDRNYNAIKAILSTSYSRECQDNLVKADLASYIEVANSLGVTSFDAQIYFCDMYNQQPVGATDIAKASSDKSLDGLHTTCLSGGYWLGGNQYNNRDRRIRVYNAIKLLGSTGGLNPTSSTNISNTSSLGTVLLYPTECKNVVEPFASNHRYIVIAPESNRADFLYSEVKAPISGSAYFSSKTSFEDGWYVEITNGKYVVRLCNLADYTEGHGATKEVQMGETIGRVGYTITREPCLIVKFRINGVLTDPLPYFGTGVSSNVNVGSNGVVETAVNWMINIANDNSHGYSQTRRYGPDYDCTSLCTHGYINAGLNIDPSTWTYTMKANFERVGFTAIPYTRGMALIRGDVLLVHATDHQHAICYIGNNQAVAAHGTKGHPEEGDTSGDEISVTGFSDYSSGTNYQWVLRYTGG